MVLHCLDDFEQPNNIAMLDPTPILTYLLRYAYTVCTYFSQAEIDEILAGRERRISLGTLSLR